MIKFYGDAMTDSEREYALGVSYQVELVDNNCNAEIIEENSSNYRWKGCGHS